MLGMMQAITQTKIGWLYQAIFHFDTSITEWARFAEKKYFHTYPEWLFDQIFD